MKIILDVDNEVEETEVIIKCKELNNEVMQLQSALLQESKREQTLELTSNGKSYFISIDKLLFFETNGSKIAAHTKSDYFECNMTLRDLEDYLPGDFLRVSKSTILNINYVQSISRNLTGASEIEFSGTDKTTYVSRSYFKMFMDKMKERR